MNILQESVKIVHRFFLPHIQTQQKYLFQFGISAFLLTPRFESLNSNARLIVENRNTAVSKVYRLLRNETLLDSFSTIVSKLHLVHDENVVIIDFSTFCGFQVLTLALQTHQGRAVPVYFDCLTYPIEFVGSQNIFIIETIKRFVKQFDIKPTFVLDRGFAIPSLIKFFVKEEMIFYVRCKQAKSITIPDGKGGEYTLSAYALKHTSDTAIKAYGDLTLRLVKSSFNPKKHKEPWYILTNDFSLTRKKVIAIYYHRFEIEEAFKDLKHLFGLKKLLIKRMMSFKVLLWFMILKIILAYLLQTKLTQIKTHAKKSLSFLRSFSETLQRSSLLIYLPSSWKRHF